MTYTTTTLNPAETLALGMQVGRLCRGGETIELVSDLGGGKTVFVQGLAKGLGYTGDVSSPTFVISRDYQLPNGLSLHHFDLYRIHDGDVAALELAEFIADPQAITAVEWASNVHGVLPDERITVAIQSNGEESRNVTIAVTPAYNYIIGGIEK